MQVEYPAFILFSTVFLALAFSSFFLIRPGKSPGSTSRVRVVMRWPVWTGVIGSYVMFAMARPFYIEHSVRNTFDAVGRPVAEIVETKHSLLLSAVCMIGILCLATLIAAFGPGSTKPQD